MQMLLDFGLLAIGIFIGCFIGLSITALRRRRRKYRRSPSASWLSQGYREDRR
jgi:hypothetical protein